MGECAEWAVRAQEYDRLGETEKAERALVMAQRFLKKAKAIDAQRQRTN
jgi:hypothetical protein